MSRKISTFESNEGRRLADLLRTQKSLKTKEPCQEFIALGQILPGEAYPFEMAPDFIPDRKDISFLKNIQSVPLEAVADFPLWQEYRSRLRFGHFQIPEELFNFIVSGMKKEG